MREMTLCDLQKFSLKILKEVHVFCKKNNIRYSLAYGTLIGAIRHKGFIPWDEDIDVVMPRPDFERFCKTYKSKMFKIVEPSDPKCWIGFARVCDTEKTYAETFSRWCEYDTGVWIDIFPIDGASDCFADFQRDVRRSHFLWMKQLYCRNARHAFSKRNGIVFNIALFIKKILRLNGKNLEKYNNMLVQNAKKIKYGETKHFSQLVCLDVGDKDYQKKEDFSYVVEVPFEDGFFDAMNGYDSVLKKVYGDYMKLPAPEKRIPKLTEVKFFWRDLS